MKYLLSLVLLTITLIWSSSASLAQERRTGTAGASQLNIPVGVAGIGLGGSTLATTVGIESIYWNPAGLADSRKGELLFSSMKYLANIDVSYFAASANFGNLGSVAVSFKTIDFGDIIQTSDADPEGLAGVTFSPTFLTAGITYARNFTDRASVGITTKLISERIGNTTALGVAFDFGVQYKTPNGFRLAVAIRHLGNAMRYSGSDLQVLYSRTPEDGFQNQVRATITSAEFEIPSVVEAGLGYEYKLARTSKLTFTGNYRNNNFTNDEYLFGTEYNFQDLIFLRVGYQLDGQGQTDNIFSQSFSFGGGLNYKVGSVMTQIDYAFRGAKVFDNNQVFSIRIGF